jgi:protein-S-isoprenylcysteine O-methyltransferase Ste14
MWLAGTWHWWRAWVLLGVVAITTVSTMFLVFLNQPGLLEERTKPIFQKGQPLSDKVIIVLLLLTFFGQIIFIPLDVFRFRLLLGKPGVVISSLGLALFILGWLMIALTFRANAFAAPVVRHQSERHHKVADTGVYAIVRHPMYSSTVVLMVGLALWLESYAGAVAALAPALVLGVRILIEESFLKRELPGYLDYTKRVRWRLVPGIW